MGTVESTQSSSVGQDNTDSGRADKQQDAGASEDTTAATTEEVSNEFIVGDIVETDEFKISYISADVYVEENQLFSPFFLLNMEKSQ